MMDRVLISEWYPGGYGLPGTEGYLTFKSID